MRNNSHCLVAPFLFSVAILGLAGCGEPDADQQGTPQVDAEKLAQQDDIVPMLIVGSGPAGLSAAVYGARGGFKTVVVEGAKPGGQLMDTSYVENWPGLEKELGRDLIGGLRKQAARFGAQFIEDEVIKVDFARWPYMIILRDGKPIQALSVVIATGATPRTLGVPGEQEYWGKGVTTCAICDARFYDGKEVVVVGGGDSAAEEAMQLAVYASKITILVRKDQMRAAADMQKRLKGYPQIHVRYSVEVHEIVGDRRHVTGVQLHNNKTGETALFKTDGFFLAIGHIPNTQLFADKLQMNQAGYVVVHGRSQETSVAGVFAAGDVEDDHYRQAGVASGDGIKAALDAAGFLGKIGLNEIVDEQLQKAGAYYDVRRAKRVQIPLIADEAEFEKQVLKAKKPVLVDFFGQACPTCTMMAPVFADVATELLDDALFFKVDASALVELGKRYDIRSIPAFVLFKDGNVSGRIVGMAKKEKLIKLVRKAL